MFNYGRSEKAVVATIVATSTTAVTTAATAATLAAVMKCTYARTQQTFAASVLINSIHIVATVVCAEYITFNHFTLLQI